MTAWIPFNTYLGSNQELPEERAIVAVALGEHGHHSSVNGLAVGWFRYAAGDQDSPFFVIPDIGGKVVAWAPLAIFNELEFVNWPQIEKEQIERLQT